MKYILLLAIVFLFTSCQGFKDVGKVLRNEKVRTTDEFLIEKKGDLVLPPDYKKLPSPNSLSKKKGSGETNKIQNILKTSKEENVSSGTSSSEESILKEIRK